LTKFVKKLEIRVQRNQQRNQKNDGNKMLGSIKRLTQVALKNYY